MCSKHFYVSVAYTPRIFLTFVKTLSYLSIHALLPCFPGFLKKTTVFGIFKNGFFREKQHHAHVPGGKSAQEAQKMSAQISGNKRK